jgi:hypothetical protein
MGVNTLKFSQFASANLGIQTNQLAGVNSTSGGQNFITPFTNSWTTITRPAPYNGLSGYNSSLNQWEFWNGTNWEQFGTSSGNVNPGVINDLAFYASSGNVVSPLSSEINSILVTSASGIPSLSNILPSGLIIPGYAFSGNNNNITSMSGLTGYLRAPLGILDINGNNVIAFGSVLNAVNYILFQNQATGFGVGISAAGSDNNILLSLQGKGTSGVNIYGTSTNNIAPSGVIGQLVSSVVNSGSAVNIPTSGVAINVTSISVPAGNWDIFGNVFILSNGYNLASVSCWSSLTSGMAPDSSLYNSVAINTSPFIQVAQNIPQQNYNFSVTTTVYLSCAATFASGTNTACGGIYARRRY